MIPRRLKRKEVRSCGCLLYRYERLANVPCANLGGIYLYQTELAEDVEIVYCRECHKEHLNQIALSTKIKFCGLFVAKYIRSLLRPKIDSDI